MLSIIGTLELDKASITRPLKILFRLSHIETGVQV